MRYDINKIKKTPSQQYNRDMGSQSAQSNSMAMSQDYGGPIKGLAAETKTAMP